MLIQLRAFSPRLIHLAGCSDRVIAYEHSLEEQDNGESKSEAMETSGMEGSTNRDRENSNNNVKESINDKSYREEDKSEGSPEGDENEGNIVPMSEMKELESGEGVD